MPKQKTSITEKFKHDFINNSLRIEIINKVLCESLENNQLQNQEHIFDLKFFLKDHLDFLEQLDTNLD
jgi:hypothetical protein